MFLYQLRLAWKSLRRNPVLSVALVLGIALGIAVSMSFVTVHYRLSGNPIPHKSDRLFYVQVDFWNPERAWDDENPSDPPNQLTYRDAAALMASAIPTHQSSMYKADLTIHPDKSGQRPFREDTRMCSRGFFAMFEPPFRYGGPWGQDADEAPHQVVVIGDDLNQRLYGGENSVGRKLRIEDREFEIAGVLAPWRPMPKYYDTHNEEFGDPEEVFLPFLLGREMEIRTAGNTSSWKSRGPSYQELLDSESIWLQHWVQLDDEPKQEEYRAFLDGYLAEQKTLGRPARPQNTKLRDVMSWLVYSEVVPEEANAMVIIALLFLLICSVNLIGILLGKFLARAPEVGVRRALGASRRWVFVQHLLECEIIGVLGCALGLVLTQLGIGLIRRLFEFELSSWMDPALLGIALVLALLSALIAGIYPAWTICRIPPAAFLKTQ